MGYTHYVHQHQEATTTEWKAIHDGVAALLAASPVEIAGLLGEQGTPPELNSTRIAFNGVEDEGFETFILQREPTESFSFCKTNERPYDLLVTAALIVATHHAPHVYTVKSDGHDFEWTPALSFVGHVLGEGYDLPPLVASNEGFVEGYRKPGEPGYDRARAAYEQEHGQAA